MALRRRATAFDLFSKIGLEKKPRMMRYDLNALADFEQQCGMGIGQLLTMKAVFATTRAMMWCGAKHADAGFTLEGAGDLIQEYLEGGEGRTISDVLSACFEIATEHGALGVPKKLDDDDDGTAPNVFEVTQTESAPALLAGEDGSTNPKKLPSVP